MKQHTFIGVFNSVTYTFFEGTFYLSKRETSDGLEYFVHLLTNTKDSIRITEASYKQFMAYERPIRGL